LIKGLNFFFRQQEQYGNISGIKVINTARTDETIRKVYINLPPEGFSLKHIPGKEGLFMGTRILTENCIIRS